MGINLDKVSNILTYFDARKELDKRHKLKLQTDLFSSETAELQRMSGGAPPLTIKLEDATEAEREAFKDVSPYYFNEISKTNRLLVQVDISWLGQRQLIITPVSQGKLLKGEVIPLNKVGSMCAKLQNNADNVARVARAILQKLPDHYKVLDEILGNSSFIVRIFAKIRDFFSMSSNFKNELSRLSAMRVESLGEKFLRMGEISNFSEITSHFNEQYKEHYNL